MNQKRMKEARAVYSTIAPLVGLLESMHNQAEAIATEEREAYDNMPENLRNGDKGTAIDEAATALETATESLETALDALNEAVSQLSDLINN